MSDEGNDFRPGLDALRKMYDDLDEAGVTAVPALIRIDGKQANIIAFPDVKGAGDVGVDFAVRHLAACKYFEVYTPLSPGLDVAWLEDGGILAQRPFREVDIT